MIGIYRITNLINKKCYIGQSKYIETRLTQHKKNLANEKCKEYKYPLYCAIRKYGLNNFSFDIIEECKISLLDDRERYWIQYYNSFFNGYNQTFGGTNGGHNKINKENILGIIKDLETTTMFHREIAEKWNVSQALVLKINTGKAWRQDREYPLQKGANSNLKIECFCIDCGKEIGEFHHERCRSCYDVYRKQKLLKESNITALELAKMILENSLLATARYFNVDHSTIRRWCKIFEIPYIIEDLRHWYQKQTGEMIISSPNRPTSIKVNQYSLDDEYVRTFSSLSEAGRFCGKNDASNIGKACKGVLKTAYGFKWKYAD